MQIFRSFLKVALGATVIVPTIGAMPPVFAQEKTNQATPPANKRTPNFWATGDVTVIDDTTQTFKILDYTSRIVQKQVGDKTIEVIERGVERVQTFKLTPQTKVVREERDISANQLRVGDSVSYIGTKGHGVVLDTITYTAKVTSVTPLALELKGFKTNNLFVGSDTVTVVLQGDLLLA